MDKSFPKAAVCKVNTCVSVYGDAAKTIEEIAVTTVAILAFALLAKALN